MLLVLAAVAIAAVGLTTAALARVAPVAAGSPPSLPAATESATPTASPLRVAAIGDSITESDGTWINLAVAETGNELVLNASVAGSTTSQFATRIPDVVASTPDVVFILGGTNDIGKVGAADSIANITRMVDELDAAGIDVVLSLIPPMDGRAPDVTAINEDIASLADSRSLPLIDFFSILADGDHYAANLTDDGVHPNYTGQQLMGRAATPHL